jgi:dTDP-4-dehydrorhamnose reductase
MRVLLTGAGGFVGSNLRYVFERHGAELLAPSHGELDVTDSRLVARVVAATRPQAIVHAAIWNDLVGLRRDRRRAWENYVGATRNLTDAANEIGARIVLISTDWVFDGTQGPAEESTPPQPVNVYGFLKAASELVISERARRGTIARVSGVQGIHRARATTVRDQDAGFGYLAVSVVRALSRGKRFGVWDGPGLNRLATPTLATDAGELIWRALELDLDGVLHCCGGEHASRVELALRTARAFELDEDLIDVVAPPAERLPTEGVPVDTRLDASATAARLGVAPASLEVTLGRLRAQLAELGGEQIGVDEIGGARAGAGR